MQLYIVRCQCKYWNFLFCSSNYVLFGAQPLRKTNEIWQMYSVQAQVSNQILLHLNNCISYFQIKITIFALLRGQEVFSSSSKSSAWQVFWWGWLMGWVYRAQRGGGLHSFLVDNWTNWQTDQLTDCNDAI